MVQVARSDRLAYHSQARSEREQTNESLRLERQHSDNALEQIAAIDATAADVISPARDRLRNSCRQRPPDRRSVRHLLRVRAPNGSANGRDDSSRAKVTGSQATFEHRFARATLRNAFRAYHYDLNRRNTLVSAVVGNDAVRTRGIVRRVEDRLFNQTELSANVDWLSARHQLLTGVEFDQQQKDQVFLNFANIDRVPLYQPEGYRVPNVPASARPGTDNVGYLNTAGVYAQDLISIGEHWKALLGTRLDVFARRTEERRPGQPDLERTDRTVSPRAGLVYQPQPWSALYASVSQSFQPSAESFPLAANNARIKLEQTRNYEIGAKYDQFGGAFSTTLSIFQLRRTNIKTTDPAAPSRLIPIGEQRPDLSGPQMARLARTGGSRRATPISTRASRNQPRSATMWRWKASDRASRRNMAAVSGSVVSSAVVCNRGRTSHHGTTLRRTR